MLFDELKRTFLQVHASRRLSRKAHMCARSEEDHRQMLKRSEHVDIPLARFAFTADKDRCRDDDVCLGSGSGDDGDDEHVRLLRVFFLFLLIA